MTIQLDFTNIVIACTNKYDVKDDLVYYFKNETYFESQTTGTMQYTFIDVFGNKRMLNEFEVDNYNCSIVKTQDEFEKIVTD